MRNTFSKCDTNLKQELSAYQTNLTGGSFLLSKNRAQPKLLLLLESLSGFTWEGRLSRINRWTAGVYPPRSGGVFSYVASCKDWTRSNG